MGAQPIDLADRQVWEEAVEDPVGPLGEGQARGLALRGGVEQAKLEPLGMSREHGEIDPTRNGRRSQGVRAAGSGSMTHRRILAEVHDKARRVAAPAALSAQ